MKKRIILLLICVLTLTVLLCIFTACKNETPGDNTGTENGEGTTEGGGATEGDGTETGGEQSTHTHSFTSKTATAEYLKSPATAESDAEFYYKCTECNGKGAETYTYHSEGLEYCLDDTYYELEGYGECVDANVVIPYTYNGKPVKGIGYSAFEECIGLKSIVIPDSVTSIGRGAFQFCLGLTSVTIGNSVESVGDHAFNACPGLTSISIPNSVTSIGEGAFLSCFGLTSVTIGNSVESIGDYAFGQCMGITSISIPDSVTSIGEGAFESCFKLAEVINKSTLNITATSYGLNAKEVHTGETKVVNKNGYLFMTSGGENYLLGYVGPDAVLILPSDYNGENYKINSYAFTFCLGLRSITIPSTVTSIGEGAFEGCFLAEVINKSTLNITATSYGLYAKEVHTGESKVVNKNGYLFMTSDGENYLLGYVGTDTELILPSDYNGENYKIHRGAFAFCLGLRSITIPSTVTSIDVVAFSQCVGLTSIKYRGTEAQWNEISKEDGWDGGLDYDYITITYNYTGE